MNTLVSIVSIVVMLIAIASLVLNNKLVDTSTVRLHSWLLFCILLAIVAFCSQSAILCIMSLLCFVRYMYTPSKIHDVHHHH